MTLPPFMNRRNLEEIDVALALCGMMSKTLETTNFEYSHEQAASIVDASLGDSFLGALTLNEVTPPSSPSPSLEMKTTTTKKVAHKAKKSSVKKSHRPASSAARGSSRHAPSCCIPTKRDPMDPTFLTTLHSDDDAGRINPAHVEVRRSVLEVRRTVSGRVFFQCGCCAHLPRSERAKQSTVAPQSLELLYRANVRFMMHHVTACEHIPEHIREMNASALRLAEQGGASPRAYWEESARAMGLRNDMERKCIVVEPLSIQAPVDSGFY